MNEPDRAADYQDRDVRAAYSVLIELGQVLGAYRDKFVIVGGAVPWLLLRDARPQHIGTLDIDIDLNCDALTEGEYATLVEQLERRGYERGKEGLKEFQMRRWVNVDDGEPIAVLVDLLVPREAKTKKNKPKFLDGFRAQQIPGGKIALDNNIRCNIAGRMPDGRNNSVELLVATLPALLVMKGHSIVGRDKKKDCYDIYFTIRNYDGGVSELAEASRGLLQDAVAREAFGHICKKFAKRDAFGPETVRVFVQESDALGEMTPDQVQTDAFMQVWAFIKALGLNC